MQPHEYKWLLELNYFHAKWYVWKNIFVHTSALTPSLLLIDFSAPLLFYYSTQQNDVRDPISEWNETHEDIIPWIENLSTVVQFFTTNKSVISGTQIPFHTNKLNEFSVNSNENICIRTDHSFFHTVIIQNSSWYIIYALIMWWFHRFDHLNTNFMTQSIIHLIRAMMMRTKYNVNIFHFPFAETYKNLGFFN